EAGEGAPECLALAEDREPGEAGLEPFEAEALVEAALIADGAPPFVVVVRLVGRVVGLPAADRLGHAPATEYSLHSPGPPFSSAPPRSSNSIPEPATRSFTVCETSTSPGPAGAATRPCPHTPAVSLP